MWNTVAGMSLTSPRIEGTVPVRNGRVLSFAEFGHDGGRTVVWLHGTPGGRRQIPEAARTLALKLGVRIIGVDRPGIGASTPFLYDSVLDFATDLACVLDHCEVDRVAMVGLSGGGPYALATGHAFPDRVAAIGILGGVGPTRGRDRVEGGPISLAVRAEALLSLFRDPCAMFLHSLARMLVPVASQGFNLYARLSPEGDRKVFEQPEIKEMFLDDLINASRKAMKAPIYDLILFTRHWGFSLESVEPVVNWWHGDADHFVPLEHARHMASILPRCTLSVRPGESHLGGMGAAEEVLTTVLSTWDSVDGIDAVAARTAR